MLRRPAGIAAADRHTIPARVMTDPRTPVIVGVGQYTDRLDTKEYRGLSSVELAVEAASRACRDALTTQRRSARCCADRRHRGAAHVRDSIPRYSTPFGKSDNFPHSIARRLGATPRTAVWASVGGDTPQPWSASSASALRAARSVPRCRRLGGDLDLETPDRAWAGRGLGRVDRRAGRRSRPRSRRSQHALHAATRPHPGADLIRDLRACAPLATGIVAVGLCARDGTAVRAVQCCGGDQSLLDCARGIYARDAGTAGERNRMIADPYTRLLVARDQVNQAAAVLITSTEAARELGIDRSEVGLPAWLLARERARDHESRGSRRIARGAARVSGSTCCRARDAR